MRLVARSPERGIVIGLLQNALRIKLCRPSLAELVSVATSYAGTQNLGRIKGAMVTGAIHGAAVAAGGGDIEAVRRAMLSNGGAVLVQGLSEVAAKAKDKIKAEGEAFIAGAFEGEALTGVRKELEKAKDMKATVDQALALGRRAYSDVKATADKARATLEADLDTQLKDLRSKIDAARATAIVTRDATMAKAQEAEQALDKPTKDILAARDAAVKAGKDVAAAEQEAKQRLETLRQKARASVETLEAKAREEMAGVEKVVNQHLKSLAELRGYRVDQILSQDGTATARALSNDYVLSWTAAEGVEPPTVVVTYAGAGSHLGQLVDSIETPEVGESAPDAK